MLLLKYFLCFFFGSIIQSVFINGVYMCFEEGMILFPLKVRLKKVIKNEWYHKPLFSCVRCMASVYSFITYWPFVLYNFGFSLVELPVYVLNIGVLVYVNFFFYKKI